MASGDAVIQVLEMSIPQTLYAQIDTLFGTAGTAPAEALQVIDFNAGTDEFLDFKCKLVGYDGGGIELMLPFSTSSGTGDVVWGAAIRRLQEDAEDITSSHTYDFNTKTIPSASTVGKVAYGTLGFSDGSDMDNWADGEVAIIRITRDANAGGDTLAGDAELWGIFGVEK